MYVRLAVGRWEAVLRLGRPEPQAPAAGVPVRPHVAEFCARLTAELGTAVLLDRFGGETWVSLAGADGQPLLGWGLAPDRTAAPTDPIVIARVNDDPNLPVSITLDEVPGTSVVFAGYRADWMEAAVERLARHYRPVQGNASQLR